VAGLWGATALAAQEPGAVRDPVSTAVPAEPRVRPATPLSFEEAVGRALESNPAYQRQLNAATSAGYTERSRFGAAFLPNLQASLGFNGSTFRRKTAEDDFGNPIGGADFIENTTSSTSQGISSGLTLFDMQSWQSYGQARAQTEARFAAADVGAAQLRTQVGRAYYQATRADRLIEVEERQLESARRQLEAVQELLRVAAKQPTDVLGAELQVAQAEQAVQQARGDARKTRLTLKQVMGVELGARYELTSGFPTVFDPATLDVDGLIRRAMAEGPRIGQQAAELEAARRSLSVARAARFPTITGSVGASRSTSAQDYNAFGELNPPNTSWGFGLSVNVPVFNRFSTSAQIGQARIQVADAEATLRESRLQVEMEVRSAVIDLESAYTGVRLAEQSARIARNRLEQGEELYRLGSIRYTDLQRMFEEVASAERGVVSAYAQFAEALLQLEEKLGTPLSTP
jgi:outer membrane protein TolC